MSLITITSDMGSSDIYTGVIKGACAFMMPDVRLIEITHDIAKHNIVQAAMVLKSAYPFFPAGTIHIVSVNSNVFINRSEQYETSHIAFLHQGHYFIGTDNGIFSLIFDEIPTQVTDITHLAEGKHTFPLLHVFLKAASLIQKGVSFEKMGPLKPDVIHKTMLRPVLDPHRIVGNILYIDSYGNAITNISLADFERIRGDRNVEISIRKNPYHVRTIHKHYSSVAEGDIVALFNHQNYLELAINKGDFSSLLGMNMGDTILITFN